MSSAICKRIWGIAGFLAVLAGPARADLTVKDLTDPAIAVIGPFYQDVDDAIKKFANRDFAGALANLESAKKSTPKLAPAEIMMAQLYLDARQPAPAIAMLESAIQKSPQDPEALVMLVERAAVEGRSTECGLMFEKAAKILDKFTENPRRKQNLQTRLYAAAAAADETASNWSEAQKKLEALLKLDSRNAIGHHRLGNVLFRLGQQKEAYAEFQAAAEQDKNLPPADLVMASLVDDKLKADQWLKRAVQISGNDLRTRLGAGEFLLRQNQVNEAKEQIDAALKLDPQGLQTNSWAGVICRMQGDYKQAEKYLSAAHLLSPTDASITNHLALVLLESPGKENQLRALQFAEMNAQNNPNNNELMASLAWINYRLNRPVEAHRAFSAVLNSNSVLSKQAMSGEMAFYLAHLAKEQGKISEAVRLLKEALNNNEPFAYRKPANELLAQWSKLEKPTAGKATRPASQRKSGDPPGKAASKADSAKAEPGKPDAAKPEPTAEAGDAPK